MSFKDKAYDYFDRTIKLLRGSNKMREMMLLSYYYGAEMSFLMNDSRVKEALELAFEREKLIKRLEALPQIPEGYVDGQYSYLYAKLAYIYYVKKKECTGGTILSKILVEERISYPGWENVLCSLFNDFQTV